MPKVSPLADRFWPKVNKTDGCWEWTAFKMRNGYGTIGVGDRRSGKDFAHRVSWILHNGPIPEGMYVCHRCDNPACVRPEHLFLGTPKENQDDMRRKGRQRNPPGHKGEKNCKARLTRDDVLRVFELKRAGWTQARIGVEFGVSQGQISQVLVGRCWSHLGLKPIRTLIRRAAQ